MKRLLLFLLFPLLLSAQMPGWVNVKTFGAKGDGVTDDVPAILAAVNAARQRGMHGGNIVYFPPSTGCYRIGSPLTLSPNKFLFVTLFFDGCVLQEAPVTIGDYWILKGNAGGGGAAFADDMLTFWNVGWGVMSGPAIHIHGVAIRLENLDIKYIRGSADGIVIDGSSQLFFKNTFVSMDGQNTAGVAVRIIGGFGFRFDGGGYNSSGTGPSIQIQDSPACNSVGIILMRHLTFAHGGIVNNANCDGGGMSFDDILFEGAAQPFLTLNVRGGNGLHNFDMRAVRFADSIWPGFPLILVNSMVRDPQNHGAGNVTIINSSTDYGVPLVQGLISNVQILP